MLLRLLEVTTFLSIGAVSLSEFCHCLPNMFSGNSEGKFNSRKPALPVGKWGRVTQSRESLRKKGLSTRRTDCYQDHLGFTMLVTT